MTLSQDELENLLKARRDLAGYPPVQVPTPQNLRHERQADPETRHLANDKTALAIILNDLVVMTLIAVNLVIPSVLPDPSLATLILADVAMLVIFAAISVVWSSLRQ